MSRYLRQCFHKWKYVLISIAVIYLCILYLPIFQLKELEITQEGDPLVPLDHHTNRPAPIKPRNRDHLTEPSDHRAPGTIDAGGGEKFVYKMEAHGKNTPFYIESVMTSMQTTLKERLTCNVKPNTKPKILLSWNAGHGNENLGGCRDWNCQIIHSKQRLAEADAVMMMYDDPEFKRRDSDQYVVYFSQESPMNSGWFAGKSKNFFNMSLGFRHDTAAASPYGYTVKLAPPSRKKAPFYDSVLVNGKTKGAAWFVSHCGTNSRRENIVRKLQEYFPVDIYGGCGKLKCPRGASCENALDTEYHFYIAFENSICKDYITEKLWNQGYRREIIPVVLKRSIVEQFVPPNSFIAVDDFQTIQEMADYLHYLMKNKTAYGAYFNWRQDYRVVFLDGTHHDALERPWGFCQICRLMWESPLQHHVIEDFQVWWGQSCESDGELANKILSGTMKDAAPGNNTYDKTNKNLRDRISNYNKEG